MCVWGWALVCPKIGLLSQFKKCERGRIGGKQEQQNDRCVVDTKGWQESGYVKTLRQKDSSGMGVTYFMRLLVMLADKNTEFHSRPRTGYVKRTRVEVNHPIDGFDYLCALIGFTPNKFEADKSRMSWPKTKCCFFFYCSPWLTPVSTAVSIPWQT